MKASSHSSPVSCQMVIHVTHSTAARENNFNFLRLFFALLVILSHSTLLLDGNEDRELLTRLVGFTSFGQMAVEGFFLLSGYLIVQSWMQSPDMWSFLKKRILRIYPGFIMAALLCAFVVGPLGADPRQYFEKFWYGGFFRSVALLRIPVVPEVFQGRPFPIINGSVWTIAFEFICYIGVLAYGSLGFFRHKAMWLFLTIAVYATILLYTFSFPPLKFLHSISWAEPLLRLPAFFLIGGCFFLYRGRIRYKSAIALASAAAILFFVAVLKIHYLIFALAGAYLLFYLAFLPIGFLKGYSNLPDVSYGTYLYGWPVQKLLLWYFPITSPWLLFFLAVALSLLLGAASWYAVEKPFMKLKSFRVRKQILALKPRWD